MKLYIIRTHKRPQGLCAYTSLKEAEKEVKRIDGKTDDECLVVEKHEYDGEVKGGDSIIVTFCPGSGDLVISDEGPNLDGASKWATIHRLPVREKYLTR